MSSAVLYIASFIAYALFNGQIWRAVAEREKLAVPRAALFAGALIVNYTCFVVFSALQLNLIINWMLVCVLLVIESRIAFRMPWRRCAFYALLICVVGLAVNEFARSLCSLVLDLPQSAFNNDIYDAHNYKTIPVVIGFLLAAGLIALLRRLLSHDEVATVCANPRSRRFVTGMAGIGFVYLCSVLILYYIDADAAIVKVWAMKASLSVLASVALAFFFAYRSAYLIRCGRERRAVERDLEEHEREREELQLIAQRDALTGCCTRGYARELIDRLGREGIDARLVFIDVNDLKSVNDSLGHEAGDRYLVALASALDAVARDPRDVLCRYGGDEFVAVVVGATEQELRDRLEEASHRLRTEGNTESFPFPMSMSFGMTELKAGERFEDALVRADVEMYRAKRARRAAS